MMNDDMIRNIEYLREKADVSYEEAATLLERYDGNVMRVLVELERQGRIYDQAAAGGAQQAHRAQAKPQQAKKNESKAKAADVINRAFEYHMVIEGGNGEKKTIANLSAPFVVVAAAFAPHLAIASAAITFVCGYRVKFRREKGGKVVPDNVEEFVDNTVSNIKKTASSLGETVRGERKEQPQQDAPYGDDDGEGGEITID